MNKSLGNIKKDKVDRGKEFALTSGAMKTRAKAAEAGKSARLTTSTSKPSGQGDMDIALQAHSLKKSEPVLEVPAPIVEPEKPVYKIYADHVTIVNREEKTK